ncbi:MAG: S-layer homology domain-containing protein [Oscillospiraceae bacterium]|nr:S-layer homology domain-containing protein [Oscillospiraceae bacterium]
MKELPQATSLIAEIEDELYVGATVDVDVSVRLTDGTEYRIEKMLSGEDEETNTYSLTSTDEEVVVVNPDGTVKAVGTGKAGIVISADIEGSTIEKTVPVTVGSAVFDKVELQFSSDRLFIGGQITASVRALLDNGEEINSRDYSVVISSNPDSVATTEGNVITGVSEGNIEVTAEVWFNEEMKSKTETLMVEPVKLSAIEASVDKKFISLLDDTGGKISVKGVNNDGSDASIEGALLTYKAIDTEFVDVTEDGFVKAKAAGLADIEVTADIGGIIFTDILTVVASSAKSAPTIYTYSMRENAKENAGKYDWAKALKKDAVTNADEFLVHLDELYEMIPYEGIPRAFMVGLKMDPNGYSCIYCGEDLRNSYGSYAWEIDPFARPWKIQCPSCKRLFPSNDFGSFYKLGFDEHGQFNVERARQKHHEMLFHADGSECSCQVPTTEHTKEWYEFYGYGNKTGYLYNELYSEVGSVESKIVLGQNETAERWGVDDGLGYVTGEIAENNKPEKKTFIAYYNSLGLWVRNGGSQGKYIIDALDSLRDAYLYTGDIKYGRAGAILVDRIADVYPSYDLRPWAQDYPNSDGGRNTGKIVGAIWDCGLITSVIRAYDAFYPAMEDEYVIRYLSEKAATYNLNNTKTSADLIRENCETGILRETFKAAKTSQVYGNFGMHQQSVAFAGVALDAEAETREMFDWLAAYSSLTKDGVVTTANSGGEMLTRYINDVDRDGFGNEVGAGYNRVWYTNTLDIAELLENYDFDTEIDLYENPKYIKMLSAQISMTLANGATLSVGDEGSTASTGQTMKADTQILAFARTGEPRFAQLAYYLNGNSVDDLHLDIFQENPENIQSEVKGVIEEYGELKLESENKAGYGLAIMRGGDLYNPSSLSAKKDTRRDVWMYYGRNNTAHAHFDKLQLGIDAYGFNFMPDLGYPAATGSDPNRHQWVNATISHNTVVVNEKRQNSVVSAKPLHFDDSDIVKVIDVDASNVYSETSIYRRTAVTVEANDDVAYTVDFFRIKGGKDHLYSFHTQSNTSEVVFGVDLIPQTDENGNYVGSYAGRDVPFGNDPDTVATDALAPLKYPRGYTWLRNIRRDAEPDSGTFSVNFKQTDFNRSAADSKNLNMRITMLNDWVPTDVTIAVGETPLIAANENIPELDYLLVKRSGNDLDTLYTSVLEPYKGERYISDIQSVDLSVKDGSEEDSDIAKAIKVIHTSGKIDYIIYATNNSVTYSVTDGDTNFDFRGVVGVYTVNSAGKNIYSYVNDGDIIGANISESAAFSGKVVDFTRELSAGNSITVKFDTDVDVSLLPGKYIYISNTGNFNGSYLICGASKSGNNVILDVGDVTHITQFAIASDTDSGYSYNIAKGQKFTIPVAVAFDNGPVFDTVNDEFTATAGNSFVTQVNAVSPENEKISYTAHIIPRGASVDCETGKITWKPAASQVGENHFAIIATDESGRACVTHFDVQVYGSTTGSKPETSESDRSDETSVSNGGGGGGGGGGTASDNANSSDQTDAGEKDPVLSQDNVDGSTQPDAGDGSSDVPNFIDLGNYAWAADAINALAQNGIIKGTTSDTYSPANNITRADFALLLVRAFKLTSDNKENFSDVSAADYFAPELAIARNTGIVNGIGDNEFAPRSFITRQDMMVIVYRVLQAFLREEGGAGEARDGRSMTDVSESNNVASDSLSLAMLDSSLPEGASAEEYADFATVADYAQDAVSSLIGAGLVNGKSGHIAPTDYTTRAEVAVLIYRILEYIK